MHPTAPLDLLHLAGRLGLAVLLGGAVGFNRELRQKPAGLRTHALIALAAALLTIVGTMMTGDAGATGDSATLGRIVQGLLAGIGFIGGGVILRTNDRRGVHGLTTAAGMWLVAAVGIAVGAGLWAAGAIAIALTLLVLAVGGRIDQRLHEGENTGTSSEP
jgi:putative Mg2+ transporter-C (MgtC) family protein